MNSMMSNIWKMKLETNTYIIGIILAILGSVRRLEKWEFATNYKREIIGTPSTEGLADKKYSTVNSRIGK